MIPGPRILLSPLVRQFRNKLFHWRNDRALTQLSAWYVPVSETAHDGWMDQIAKRQDMFMYVVLERASNQPIGYCFLADLSTVHRNARLGIAIGEADYRNKGYGSEAMRALLAFGFEDLNLERIYLDVANHNLPAIHVYEKCGFVTEGLMRRHYFVGGQYRDMRMMAMLREEYAATVAKRS
jgi:RimJ/RimL family protein N-acetyltransferase